MSLCHSASLSLAVWSGASQRVNCLAHRTSMQSPDSNPGRQDRPVALLIRRPAVVALVLLVGAAGVFLAMVTSRTNSSPTELTGLAADPIKRHDQAYKRAITLISPHMRLQAGIAPVSGSAAKDLREGVRYLDVVVGIKPDNWAAWWLRGKAEEALSEHEAAYDSLRRAYEVSDKNPEVGRELVGECLETRRASEAVRISRDLIARAPKDAGLLRNLAVAPLANGQLDGAARAADASLELDPADAITAK